MNSTTDNDSDSDGDSDDDTSDINVMVMVVVTVMWWILAMMIAIVLHRTELMGRSLKHLRAKHFLQVFTPYVSFQILGVLMETIA